MIKKHHSLVQAEIVLAMVMNHEDAKDIECYAECYQNGREQGVLLWDHTKDQGAKGIYIAECRNSDEIVVYVGDYSFQSISKDAYSHRNFFGYNQHREAAGYVLETAKRLFPVGRFG